MTSSDDFELRLSRWLDAAAGPTRADYLGKVLARTAASRQRPAWSSLERWFPMATTFNARLTPVPTFARGAVALIALLILLALIATAIGARQPRLPAPFGPAANGALAFASDGDIYVTDANGAHARAIISGPTHDFAPWFSHDGTHFAFWREVTNDQVQLMAAGSDGRDVRELTPPLTQADWLGWSPSDRQLAVVHSVGPRRTLSIVDVGGGAPMRNLDVGGLSVDNDVQWIPPAGNLLLFSARPDAEKNTGSRMFTIGADGNGLRTILPTTDRQDWYMDPVISPDGGSVAYWNWEPASEIMATGGRLHVLNLASGREHAVVVDKYATDEIRPKFSPDGSLLLFERQGYPTQLMVAPANGRSPGRLIGPTFSYSDAKDFDWSPDGSTIVLTLEDHRTSLIDVATGTSSETADQILENPSWQRLAP
jgi:Tol biopolymer transport system component